MYKEILKVTFFNAKNQRSYILSGFGDAAACQYYLISGYSN